MRDTQLARAIANTLWPWLRADKWIPHRLVAVNDPRGNPTSSPGGPPRFPRPKSNPRTEEVESHPYIEDYVYPEEHPARTAWALNLTKTDHDRVLGDLPELERFDYLAARKLSTCRVPFEVTTNRHNKPLLRRNSHDATITQACAAALEAIAGAVTLQPLTDDQLLDLLLIRDDEIDLAAIENATKVCESQAPVVP